MKQKELIVYVCQKCKEQWMPRVVNPRRCPFCQTKKWRKSEVGTLSQSNKL